MKKTLIIVGILMITIILIVFYYPTPNNKPYLTILTGSAINNYKGVKYFESYHIEPSAVRVDLKEIKNIDPSEIKKLENLKLTAGPKNGVIDAVKFLTPRPIDSANILYSCTFTDLKLINLKTKELETYLYPVPPAYVVHCAWVGKDLLIHYFSATDGSKAGQINRDTPRTDHYYFFSPELGKFTPIMVDEKTSKYTAHGYGVYFLKKTDSGKAFAVAYCTKTDFFQEMGCVEYGFSISNGLTIQKLFELNYNFEWGWSGDNFFVKQKNKVYLVNINKLY